MNGTLVFAHANGFPAATYQLLFDHWRSAGLQVEAPEVLAHDPKYPVNNNWRSLRDELISFIETRTQGPVWLVGHSLGGLLSLMVACKRPDRTRGLVMLDSPVVTGWRAHSLAMAKRLGLIQKISPGKVAQKRRHQWPDREAVHAHFASKPVFARWDPRVLDDYVRAGFVETEKGVELRFSRDIETRIYNTLPDHLADVLHKHPPHCPVGFIAGTQSLEIRQGGCEGARALSHQHFQWLEGTHLYPMERPDDTAAAVLSLLREFSAGT